MWPKWKVVSKTKHSKTKTEVRSTQISKRKHPKLENAAPKSRKRSTYRKRSTRKRSTQSESGGDSGCVRTYKGRQNPFQGFMKACQLFNWTLLDRISCINFITRNTCIAEPREARGNPERVGGQERRNEVNHVTGEGGSNTVSWDVFEPSALALKRTFWDLNGVAVVSECCIGPIPPCSRHLTLLNVCNYGQKEMGVIVDNCRLVFSCICLIKAHP